MYYFASLLVQYGLCKCRLHVRYIWGFAHFITSTAPSECCYAIYGNIITYYKIDIEELDKY